MREFQRAYRLSFVGFMELHDAIEEKIRTGDIKQATNSREVPVDSRVRLAVTLRFLAGAQYIDVKNLFHISHGEFYASVWRTVDAINQHLKVEFPIDDPDKLKILEMEFRRRSRDGIWQGQVAAVDGIHFKMEGPGVQVDNPLEYYVERKGCYALLCIATCDYDRRFLSYDMSKTPRCHDSLAWRNSKLGQQVADGKLGDNFFINGDAAFSLGPGIMVPATGPGTDDFNYEQSSNRMPIECAFGILVRRWGILWRPLAVRFDRRSKVVECCMKLHNYCIDKRIELELAECAGETEIQPNRWEPTPNFDRDGRPLDYLNWCDTIPRDRGNNEAQRQRLIQAIAERGLRRPHVPHWSS